MDRSGKKDSLKAVLECSARIQGTIHVDSSKNMSLKIECKRKCDNAETSSRVSDEFELMKDCSKETVPSYCPPCGTYSRSSFKKNAIQESMKITEIHAKQLLTYRSASRSEHPREITDETTYCDEAMYNSSNSSDAYCSSSSSSPRRNQVRPEEIPRIYLDENSCDLCIEEENYGGLKSTKLSDVMKEVECSDLKPSDHIVDSVKDIYGSIFSSGESFDIPWKS